MDEDVGGGEGESDRGSKPKYRLTPTSQWLKKPRRFPLSGDAAKAQL